MTAKKALFLLIRMIFVLSSLQFMRDAFYRWDGYSYYMRFSDFLPDLSLTYIFAVIFGVIFAILLWIGIYLFKKIIPKTLNIRFEHILTWLTLCIFLLAAKKIFFKNVPLTILFGTNYFVILIIGSIIVGGIVWLLRRYNEKILNGINTRITPLVWLFIILCVVALPFSFIKEKYNDEASDVNKYVQERRVMSSLEKRPNIILVVMDALTAQDMQLYGYHRSTTPFISEWAKKSIVFNRTYSSSNWTTPSMMSMLTGQRPWTHQIWYRAYFNPVRNYKNSLPKVLQDSGYNVYGFVQNHYAHPEVLGFGNSFLIKNKSITFSLPGNSLQSTVNKMFVDRPVFADWVLNVQPIFSALINRSGLPVTTTLVPPELVYNRFSDYISRSKKDDNETSKPFFALLHVFPPHSWYLPPKPYMGFFGDENMYNTNKKQGWIVNREYPPELQPQVDILRKRYDEFILYSDKQFELFISRLAEVVDMSNTIVILTSDHGESFSHGYQEHDGPYLYEQFVQVPLIINLPEKNNSTIINMPIEQIDIAPSILGLAGIPVPEWMEGRSLLPLLEGKSLKQNPIFSMQLIKNRSFGNPIEKGTIAVWDENYKLIYFLEDKKILLFDVQADPGEKKDLSKERTGTKDKLMNMINDHLSSANAHIAQLKD